MRILLVENDFAAEQPLAGNELFSLQLVRQAARAGHDLRRLVPNTTAAGKALDARQSLFREQIDQQIVAFDPHIVHLCAIGMVGHLVLESGVPYLLSTWGNELVEFERDPRLYDLAQQVLENAGGVLFDGEATRRRIESRFSPIDRPVFCLTDFGWPETAGIPDADTADLSLDWLWPIYQEIIGRRTWSLPAE